MTFCIFSKQLCLSRRRIVGVVGGHLQTILGPISICGAHGSIFYCGGFFLMSRWQSWVDRGRALPRLKLLLSRGRYSLIGSPLGRICCAVELSQIPLWPPVRFEGFQRNHLCTCFCSVTSPNKFGIQFLDGWAGNQHCHLIYFTCSLFSVCLVGAQVEAGLEFDMPLWQIRNGCIFFCQTSLEFCCPQMSLSSGRKCRN